MCVGVVMCSEGYPGEHRKGDPISGLEKAEALPEVVVFQAGAKAHGKTLLTSGGRVLCVTAMGEDVEQARERAYEACGAIKWHGSFYRTDIGLRREKLGVEVTDGSGEEEPRAY